MGFNTTVVVLNDALDQIAKDPEFGKNLVDAIMRRRRDGEYVTVPAGNHCNAAEVIETHHADYDVLVRIGGNTGRVVADEAPKIEQLRRDYKALVIRLHDVTTELEAERTRIAEAPKGEVASFSGTGSWHVIKEDASVIVQPMKGKRVALVVLP